MKDRLAVAHQWSASNIGKSSTQTKMLPSPMYDGSPSTCHTNHGNKKLERLGKNKKLETDFKETSLARKWKNLRNKKFRWLNQKYWFLIGGIPLYCISRNRNLTLWIKPVLTKQ